MKYKIKVEGIGTIGALYDALNELADKLNETPKEEWLDTPFIVGETIKVDVFEVNEKELDKTYLQSLNKTFLQLLASQILVQDENEWEINMHEIDVLNWPDDEEEEPVDLENWRVLEIDNNHMTIVAGGDWQTGAIITIGKVGGILTVIKSIPYDEEFDNGEVSNNKLIEILSKHRI